ncbi:MAG: hypothetical protein MMC33_009847 [Icmadophila ericetorum]|nr:hypothetical protein [Icmadophila ericetorum]
MLSKIAGPLAVALSFSKSLYFNLPLNDTEELVSKSRHSLQQRQASDPPCPGGSGSLVGSESNYIAYCGMDIPSNNLLPTPTTASDLSACVDICATHRPLCLAVAFEPSTNGCALKSAIGALATQTYSVDVAIASQTTLPSSDCSALPGGQYTSNGDQFSLKCGYDYPQDDTIRIREESFKDCIDACINYDGCQAIAFDNVNGYENCYLKSSSTGQFKADPNVDAAYLSAAGVSQVSGSTSASPPASISSAPSLSASPSGSSSPSSFKPNSQSTSISASHSNSPSASTSFFQSGSASIASLPTDLPATSPSPATTSSPSQPGIPASATNIPVDPNTTPTTKSIPVSTATIIGAVVGSIAAVAIFALAIALILFQRRKRQEVRKSQEWVDNLRSGTAGPQDYFGSLQKAGYAAAKVVVDSRQQMASELGGDSWPELEGEWGTHELEALPRRGR